MKGVSLLGTGIAGLLILGAGLGWGYVHQTSRQPRAEAATVGPLPQAEAALEHLSAALRLPTVSWQEPRIENHQIFTRFHTQLQRQFPLVFSRLDLRRIGDSLLIRWPGTQQGKAILLAAHLDVVPPGPESRWHLPPFAGRRAEGFVWGRGALDDKNCALASLEAIEAQLKTGARPRHTIYLALGSDEEVGGHQGAQAMADWLKSQHVRLEAVLDEGLAIVPGDMLKLSRPVALIGLAEKGYLTLELKVRVPGGHASMPPSETAVSILAAGLLRLQAHPMPARLAGPAAALFDWLTPEMTGFNRLALANRWLFGSILQRQLAARPSTNALIRTTQAPTVLEASDKENVLAPEARALINLRVLPGDSLKAILAHYHQVLADGRIAVRVISDPATAAASQVSRTDSAFFQQLSGSVRQIFPDALVAPSLVLAATDSRHYEGLADDIYRFMPVLLTEKDFERIHGFDERIGEQAYLSQIRFYRQLLARL